MIDQIRKWFFIRSLVKRCKQEIWGMQIDLDFQLASVPKLEALIDELDEQKQNLQAELDPIVDSHKREDRERSGKLQLEMAKIEREKGEWAKKIVLITDSTAGIKNKILNLEAKIHFLRNS